jgi:hypothetical protein
VVVDELMEDRLHVALPVGHPLAERRGFASDARVAVA